MHGCTVPNRLLARVLAQHPHDFPLNIINSLLQTPKFAQWAISPWENQGLLEALVDHAEDDGQADGREDLARATRRLVEVGCGETLFLLAVEKGCISIIEALLSMSTSSPSDLSGLGIAPSFQVFDLNAWERLADMRTAIVSVLAPNGDTPLHLAMKLSDENRCFVITKILVEAGCSPCERDADDKPPVHIPWCEDSSLS